MRARCNSENSVNHKRQRKVEKKKGEIHSILKEQYERDGGGKKSDDSRADKTESPQRRTDGVAIILLNVISCQIGVPQSGWAKKTTTEANQRTPLPPGSLPSILLSVGVSDFVLPFTSS